MQRILATAFALLFYVPGLIAQSALQVTTRGFYSLQDTKTPVKIGFVTVVVNFLLSLAFLNWTNLGAGGLAFAYSLSSIFNMLLALGILGKRVGSLVDGRMWATFAKSTIASLLMGISAYYTASFLESISIHDLKAWTAPADLCRHWSGVAGILGTQFCLEDGGNRLCPWVGAQQT